MAAQDVLEYMTNKDLSYCGLMELMMEGGFANKTNQTTGENALHLLYRHAVRPLELHTTTKLLVENGCEINAKDEKGVTPIELLSLHINRGLIHHKPRLEELQYMEDMRELQSDIDIAAARIDVEYQKQVYNCLSYLLEKGALCDIIPKELPSIPHDKIWSEAFEHKIMQQGGRWTLLKFGTGMIYSKYNIFNPLSKHRVENKHNLSLLHLVAWRGDASCLRQVLKHCSQPLAIGSDGRNPLHLLYHYCNKPSDLVNCTKLLLDTGVDPNQTDIDGNIPLFLLLKHTFVKKSYIRYLANSYSESNLDVSASEDSLVNEIIDCIRIMKENEPSLNNAISNSHGNTVLHMVFSQYQQVLHNCDEGFQQMGHAMVPYSFNIKPATQIAKILIKYGAQVNAVNKEGQTVLHILSTCLSSLSLTPTVNTEQELVTCFQVLLSAGLDPNIRDAVGKAALLYLPIYPDVIRSTAGHVVEYMEPIVVLLTDYGADLNVSDSSGRTLIHRFLALKYSGGSEPDQNSWKKFKYLQGIMAFMYQRFIYLLVSRGADPSIPSIQGDRRTYVLDALYSAHQCNYAEKEADNDVHFMAYINIDALEPMLQVLTHNMTQASVYAAITKFFSCPQVTPENLSSKGKQRVQTLAEKPNGSVSTKQDGTGSKSRDNKEELGNGFTEKSLILWTQSLECDSCAMLIEAVTQPRRLKHLCRLVVWRTLGNRFANSYVQLPLPPAVRSYVGDLTSS